METKIVNKPEDAPLNSISYDIDHGIELLLEFNRQTTRFEKDFKKLTKKFKGADPEYQKKQVFKFVQAKLLPFWNTIVQPKFWKGSELDSLSSDTLSTYIFGVFVIGHSKALQQDMQEGFARTLKEMTDRAFAAKLDPSKA